MLHLIKYSLKAKALNPQIIFWPLIFPLILGTLFYFAFGNMEEDYFETISAAIVSPAESDSEFSQYLEKVNIGHKPKLIELTAMTEKAANAALERSEITGIFYAGTEPSLVLRGEGLPESILQSLLENYLRSKQALEQVAMIHPDKSADFNDLMTHYVNRIEPISSGSMTLNRDAAFFYALVAMTCLYGCFIGFSSALGLQANLSPLGARRSVTPTHKLKLIISEMFSAFLLHFLNVLILLVYLRLILKMELQGSPPQMLCTIFFGSMIGVSMGIFIGSLGRLSRSFKTALMLSISTVSTFFAGLMNGNMKDIVERHFPLINRINPAAIISDALYCTNVYYDSARYMRNIILLLVFSVILVIASFLLVRRERYDSI